MKDKRRGLIYSVWNDVHKKEEEIFILHRNFVRNGLSGRTSARRALIMKRNVVQRLRHENDTRTGLKIRSDGAMDPYVKFEKEEPRPQNHWSIERSSWQRSAKRQKHPKRSFGELFPKTSKINYKKDCLGEIRLWWRIKVLTLRLVRQTLICMHVSINCYTYLPFS